MELLDLEDDRGDDVDMFFGCTNAPCTAGFDSFFLDDNTLVAIEDSDKINSNFASFVVNGSDADFYLVTSNFFDHAGFLPAGVAFCDCEFLKWGFFGGAHIDTFLDKNVRIHLATWVAGADICDACTLPTNMTATYQGHLIGNVLNQGNLYLAAGSYNQVVRFGLGNSYSYDINVTNFDGQNFTATNRTATGGNFGMNVTANNRRLVVHGSFNGGGGDNSAEILGGFRIRNVGGAPAYDAAGIVAATKVSSVPTGGGG